MATQPNKVHHPIFARLFARIAEVGLEKGQEEHRRELLAGLAGRVVEVGAGTGVNFQFYPDTVTEVLAVEPEGYLRDLANDAAKSAPIPVKVVNGLADNLPADDASFDAGVASLVLCSVPNELEALTELKRVIRPGGELRFYEHVRGPTRWLARLQRSLDLIWPHLGGGCHLSRETRNEIENAGFEIRSCREFRFYPGGCVLAFPGAPHILGVARRSS